MKKKSFFVEKKNLLGLSIKNPFLLKTRSFLNCDVKNPKFHLASLF